MSVLASWVLERVAYKYSLISAIHGRIGIEEDRANTDRTGGEAGVTAQGSAADKMCVTGAEAAESESACLVPSTGRSGPSIFRIKSG